MNASYYSVNQYCLFLISSTSFHFLSLIVVLSFICFFFSPCSGQFLLTCLFICIFGIGPFKCCCLTAGRIGQDSLLWRLRVSTAWWVKCTRHSDDAAWCQHTWTCFRRSLRSLRGVCVYSIPSPISTVTQKKTPFPPLLSWCVDFPLSRVSDKAFGVRRPSPSLRLCWPKVSQHHLDV